MFAAYHRVTCNYAQVSVPVSVRHLPTGIEAATFSRAVIRKILLLTETRRNQSVSEYMKRWLEDFAKEHLALRTYYNAYTHDTHGTTNTPFKRNQGRLACLIVSTGKHQ